MTGDLVHGRRGLPDGGDTSVRSAPAARAGRGHAPGERKSTNTWISRLPGSRSKTIKPRQRAPSTPPCGPSTRSNPASAPFLPIPASACTVSSATRPNLVRQSSTVETRSEDELGDHAALRYNPDPDPSGGIWEPSRLPPGQVLLQPEPLFRKLDESIVEAERARMGIPIDHRTTLSLTIWMIRHLPRSNSTRS
jgi:hypothetical protein